MDYILKRPDWDEINRDLINYIDTDIAATKAAFKNYILEGKKMPIKTGIDYELKGFTFVPVYKYEVKKIIHSGPCTIVFWTDNTKTIVRLEEGKEYDEYAAFTAALAKKVYGSNSQVRKILDKKTVEEKPKKKKEESSNVDTFFDKIQDTILSSWKSSKREEMTKC